MAYIVANSSKVWLERTPAREDNGREFFDYFLVIEADNDCGILDRLFSRDVQQEEHRIELDVDCRYDITGSLIQEYVDDWAEEHNSELEDILVYERKLIRESK